MINILSIGCSLAFAPYLAESLEEFQTDGATSSRVVRQGGRGLILRFDGNLVLRHEHRQSPLGREEAHHYSAAVQFRREYYDVARLQDEVVLATVGSELLLSHPQSELWLTSETVAALINEFTDSSAPEEGKVARFPEWLKVSTGGGRILLSDQRTGRWVLLGEDHIRELERRLGLLRQSGGAVAGQAPPTIPIKGLTVHLQSALKLAETLEELADSGRVTPFEEITPTYSLKASGSTEGIELSDLDKRVALTAREARKWASIIRAELERLNVRQIERGGIRTIFAENEDGRWVLQWGDEVFVPKGRWSRLSSPGVVLSDATGYPIARRGGDFLLLLNPATGACVALTDSESRYLADL